MKPPRPVYVVCCGGCGPRIARPYDLEMSDGTLQHDPAGVCTVCESDMCWCEACWDYAAEVLTNRGCSNATEVCDWLRRRSADWRIEQADENEVPW